MAKRNRMRKRWARVRTGPQRAESSLRARDASTDRTSSGPFWPARAQYVTDSRVCDARCRDLASSHGIPVEPRASRDEENSGQFQPPDPRPPAPGPQPIVMRLKTLIPQLLLASAIGILPTTLPQEEDPPAPPPGERGYPWDRIGDKRNPEILEKLLGAWQLTHVSAKDLTNSRRQETGVLLITPDYATFELHIAWSDPLGGFADWQFQSGTHKLELDAQSHLQLTSVIGSAFNESGELEFEPAGQVRSFQVSVTPPSLVLTRLDTGDRFEFTRMSNPSLDAEKDIFGRPR